MTQASARTGRLESGALFAERYRVLRLLREGGMGAVYVVDQEPEGTRLALKVMLPEVLGNERLRERFAREAHIGTQIASPHLVRVLDAGVDAPTGMPWIAMELLQGADLLSCVHERGPMAPSLVADLLAQTCDALAAAHRAGVVHRDMKPDNVFVCENPDGSRIAKVLDFGIAKVIQEARTANSQAIGSPRWMAPEQAQEQSAIAPATDVWPLGLLAFYALTGRFYWLGSNGPKETLAKLMREMLFDPLVPASERAAALGVREKIPQGFDAWFARCVARTPGDRYVDAAAAARAMRETWAPREGTEGLAAHRGTHTAEASSGAIERAYAATQTDEAPLASAVRDARAPESAHTHEGVEDASVDAPLVAAAPVPDRMRALALALLAGGALVTLVAAALLLRGS